MKASHILNIGEKSNEQNVINQTPLKSNEFN